MKNAQSAMTELSDEELDGVAGGNRIRALNIISLDK